MSRPFDPRDAEAQFRALRGEILGDIEKPSSGGGESSLWSTVAMVGVGITAAAATAAGVHYLLKNNANNGGTKTAQKKKSKKKKRSKKKKAQKKAAVATSSSKTTKAAVLPANVSPLNVPGLSSAGGRKSKFEQMVDVLTSMYAAQQGAAMCFMAVGREQEALRLGFQTKAKRDKLGLSGSITKDAPVPAHVAARLGASGKPHPQNKCQAIRRLLSFNMGDFAMQSFAKLCKSTPVQTDMSSPDDIKMLHPIDLLITATEFAATSPNMGVKAFSLVQQCLNQACQKIQVYGTAAQRKYITDMRNNAGASAPTGVAELLATLDHVMELKRGQMGRGNLTQSSVRGVFQSQTINVAKYYFILCQNVWGKGSVPSNKAMLTLADILCLTDMYKLSRSDIKLCREAHAACMASADWDKKSSQYKSQLGIKAALMYAFEGDFDTGIKIARDATNELTKCGRTAFVDAGEGKYELKHAALMCSLLLIERRLHDACELLDGILDKVPFDAGEKANVSCIDGVVYSAWSELARFRSVLVCAREYLGQDSQKSAKLTDLLAAFTKGLDRFPKHATSELEDDFATLWNPPSIRKMTKATSKLELTMFPAVARNLGFKPPRTTRIRKSDDQIQDEESAFFSSKGIRTLFISRHIAQAASALIQNDKPESAVVAYKLMVCVARAADRQASPSGHALLCEGLISIVQLGVTYLNGSYLEDGIQAGENLLKEFEWQRKQETRENENTSTANKNRSTKINPNKWKPNVERITRDQIGRMQVVANSIEDAFENFKSAIDLAVKEASEAQEKSNQETKRMHEEIDKLREAISPEEMAKSEEIIRAKAKETGVSPEDVEKKVKQARESQQKRLERLVKQAEQKQALRGKKTVPRAMIMLQTLKCVTHVLAMSSPSEINAAHCLNLISHGRKQYLALGPVKEEGERVNSDEATPEEKVDITINTTSSEDKENSDLKQLDVFSAYIESIAISENAELWDSLGYVKREGELKMEDPAARILHLIIELGSRYAKTRQHVPALKYLQVAWKMSLHLLDPTKQTQIWVLVLKDLVQCICAISAEELIALKLERGTIPRICDLLSSKKITTERTLSVLRLKNAAIEAHSRSGAEA